MPRTLLQRLHHAADDVHHLFDAFFEADVRARRDVGRLVRPQRLHPAPFVAFGLPRLGDFLGARGFLRDVVPVDELPAE